MIEVTWGTPIKSILSSNPLGGMTPYFTVTHLWLGKFSLYWFCYPLYIVSITDMLISRNGVSRLITVKSQTSLGEWLRIPNQYIYYTKLNGVCQAF